MNEIFENGNLPEGFRRADEEDTRLVALTLAQAFADYKYPTPSTDISYSAMLKVTFEITGYMIKNALEKGFILTNEDFSAVMVTVPIKDMCEVPLDSVCEHLRQYGTDADADNLKAIFERVGMLEEKLTLNGDDIYIEAFAVQTAHQGEKRASKLMRKLFDECEKLNKNIFLFTNTERNVSIYKHFGFETICEDRCEEINSYTAFMLYKTEKEV